MDARATALVILTGLQIVHLCEEVHGRLRHRFPFGVMPRPIFVGINVLLFTLYGLTIFWAHRHARPAVPAAWILALVALGNGLGHIGVMIQRRKYFPGGYTAPLLLAAALVLMMILI